MDTIIALAHGIAQAGTGYLVGAATNGGFEWLATESKIFASPYFRLPMQFGVGFIVLGEVMRGLSHVGGIPSPIGSSVLMIWFYHPQHGLWTALDTIKNDIGYEVHQGESWLKNEFDGNNGGGGSGGSS